MRTRIISGVLGFIILLAVVYTGGVILDFFLLCVSILGLYEFKRAIKCKDIKVISFSSYTFALALFIISITNNYKYLSLIIIAYFLVLMLLFVLIKEVNILDMAFTLLSSFYIPFLIFHISFLYKLTDKNGSLLIWIIFITAWATDTFAYFTGMLFGKRKLCPKLSPKKTIEGAFGGIIGSILITVLFIMFFKLGMITKFVILSIICSVFAQIGDLTASKIKRFVGIKDYGNIIPGHGGILDRFDSLIFTAPIVYYYVIYFL